MLSKLRHIPSPLRLSIRFALISGRRKPLAVASLGLYGACLLDGSEYTGDYVDTVSPEVSQKHFNPSPLIDIHNRKQPMASSTNIGDATGHFLL